MLYQSNRYLCPCTCQDVPDVIWYWASGIHCHCTVVMVDVHIFLLWTHILYNSELLLYYHDPVSDIYVACLACRMNQFWFPFLPILFCAPGQVSAYLLEVVSFSTTGTCFALGQTLPWFINHAIVLRFFHGLHFLLSEQPHTFSTFPVCCALYHV